MRCIATCCVYDVHIVRYLPVRAQSVAPPTACAEYRVVLRSARRVLLLWSGGQTAAVRCARVEVLHSARRLARVCPVSVYHHLRRSSSIALLRLSKTKPSRVKTAASRTATSGTAATSALTTASRTVVKARRTPAKGGSVHAATGTTGASPPRKVCGTRLSRYSYIHACCTLPGQRRGW